MAAEDQAKPAKGKAGHPAWEPTPGDRAKARALFAAGASWRQVAKRLGIAKGTAEKHLRQEFEEGYEDGNLQIEATMLELAIKRKNPTMLIWLSKNRMGWSDRNEQHNTGAPPVARHEMSLRVEYVLPGDPRALAPPPPGTPMIEARAIPRPADDEASAAA